MKIKLDFVTNSSSSSFIVAFPKKPETVPELRKMMFGDEEMYRGESTNDLAHYIWNEVIGEAKTEFDIIQEYTWNGDYPDIDLSSFLNHEEKTMDWDGLFKSIKEQVLNGGNPHFMLEHEGKYIRTFSFSDECGGLQSFCEHQEIFHNLPYEQESHH